MSYSNTNKAATSLSFTVCADSDGVKLGTYLHRKMGVSQRIIRSAKLRNDGITVDGIGARTVDVLKVGQVVNILLPEPHCEIEPSGVALDIVYEDNHYILINKPSGVPVHPTSCNHTSDTLANGIVRYMKEQNDNYSVSIVNRLDKNTSGLVLVAKNAYAADRAAKSAKKIYLAVCAGEIRSAGKIDLPIDREEDSIIKRCVSENGQRAVTNYEPLKIFDGNTLLSITLETGRTHQIRVHLSHIGHPLLGDDLYGGLTDKINRHALHCAELSFFYPILGKELCFKAVLPQDMASLIN